MKEKIPKEIIRLTKKISIDHDPEKIILFGSYAWGNPGKNSDADVCVIERASGNRRIRQLRLRHFLFGIRMPVDIISYTPEELKNRLSLGDFFVKKILTQGTILYERKKTK